MRTTTQEQIARAYRARVPKEVIAERLGVTRRHVRRCLQREREAGHLPGREITPNTLIGTDAEPDFWAFLARCGDTYREIARTYLVSRQRVHQALPNAP
jgi:DNA-directed RNA polymerase sigma subunit (sigma70/sigma32)